jgi:hypothetical protein
MALRKLILLNGAGDNSVAVAETFEHESIDFKWQARQDGSVSTIFSCQIGSGEDDDNGEIGGRQGRWAGG